MCVLSMVMDYYKPKIFNTDEADFKKLVKDIKEAVDAAKKVDELTGQPDCVDPEKAKLMERVAELEKEVQKLKKKKAKKKKTKKQKVFLDDDDVRGLK